MSFEPTRRPQGDRENAPLRSRTFRRTAIIAAGLLLIAGVLWQGGLYLSDLAQEELARIVEEAAGPSASVGGVGFALPNRVTIRDIEAGPVKAGELRINLSLPGLLRRDPLGAIRRFSLLEGELDLHGEGSTATFWAQGEVSLEEEGFSLLWEQGEIELGGEIWRHRGRGRIVDGALVEAELSLIAPGEVDSRLDVALSPAQTARADQLHIRGSALPLVKVWEGVRAFIASGVLDQWPAPTQGEMDLDLWLDFEDFRPLSARGRATVSEMVWSPVETDRAQLHLDAEGPFGESLPTAGDANAGSSPADWTVTLAVELGRGRMYHHEIVEARGVVTGSPQGWSVKGVEGQGPAGAYYRAEAHLSPKGSEGPHILIDGEHVPLKEALLWLTPAGQAPAREGEGHAKAKEAQASPGLEDLLGQLAGTVSGSIRLQLGETPIGVEGQVELNDAWVGPLRLAAGNVHFESRGAASRGATVSGELELGGGRVALSGVTVHPEELSGAVSLEGVALPALETLVRAAGLSAGPQRWRGRISGEVQLHGTPESPGLSGRLIGERAGFGSIAWDAVEASGKWRGEQWEIQTFEARGPGEFRAEGKGRGSVGQGYQLELVWHGLSFKDLGEILSVDFARRIDGAISGELHVQEKEGRTELWGRGDAASGEHPHKLEASFAFQGDLDQGVEVEGTLAAGDGEAKVSLVWGRQHGRIAATLDAMPLAAGGRLLGLAGIDGAVTGQVQFEQSPGRSVVGSADLSIPQLDAGVLVIHDAAISLELDGTLSAEAMEVARCSSCLFGEGWIRGRIAASKGSRKSDPFSLRLHLLGDEVALDPAVIPLWGGRVELEGGARRSQGGWELGLKSAGSRLEYSGSGMLARLDYQANLTGPLASPQLQAAFRVREGEIDLFRLSGWGGGKSSSLRGIDLDADVDISSLRLSARSLLDAEVRGSLNVKTVGGELHAQGSVGVVRGFFGYLGRRFEIVRGVADFPGGGIIPQLDVMGTTRTQGVTLIVEATGPADDLVLSARTDPPVDQERLRELMMEPLGTGAQGLSGDWKVLASALSRALNRQVVSEFYWTVERALEDALDLDLVQIAPGEQELELTLGKYIGSRLFVAYQRSLSRAEQDRIDLEYRLGRYGQLRTRWDRQEGTHLDIGVSLPF